MKIEEKKKELLNLIDSYFKSEITVDALFEYSWRTINFFANNREILAPYQENERTFWYAIWQLQHLGDKEHEKNGTLARALSEIVSYLNNQQELPQNYEGKRP